MGIRHAAEPGLWPLLLTLWLQPSPDAGRPQPEVKPALERPADPAQALPRAAD
ncbi:MAG TPA: hypothetical protein VE033_07390 [Acetobacteraceae bacterium]|jgi:hypothetical protein|nr:hypothetical protein [Acetobacteraceae bacterium]